MGNLSYHQRRVIDLQSFLSFFDKVERLGENSQGVVNYKALCPAHQDRNPSLVIGASYDGMYLVHCYAGCTAAEVLHAVGLSLSDLYPDGGLYERGRKPIEPSRRTRTDRILMDICAADRAKGRRQSQKDKKAEQDAWSRLKRNTEWPA